MSMPQREFGEVRACGGGGRQTQLDRDTPYVHGEVDDFDVRKKRQLVLGGGQERTGRRHLGEVVQFDTGRAEATLEDGSGFGEQLSQLACPYSGL